MADITRIKRKYKMWFYTFLLLNIIILFFTIIANPYRLTPINVTIKGVNDIKPKLYDYQRYVKLFDMAYQRPRTVLLGSSRILWSVDPTHPLLQTYPPVYNAGIIGPPLYEVKHYFDHALANQPQLKRVVLGLDFYAFNAKFDNRELILADMFGKSWQDIVRQHTELLFNFGAIFETLWDSFTRKSVISIREDGRLIPDPVSARPLFKDFFIDLEHPPEPPKVAKIVKVMKDGKSVAIALDEHGNQVKPEPKKTMKNELYVPFHMSAQSFGALRDIIATCKERNIELYIFISPTYKNGEQVAFHNIGLWNQFKNFERDLAKLHPFWDFISWNNVTENPHNFIDSSHHVFPVGAMILTRILGGEDKNIPPTFGRYVTANTIEPHLKTLDKEYASNVKPSKKTKKV